MSNPVPSVVRAGVDPAASGLTVEDKATLATLLTPLVEETVRCAMMYTLHHGSVVISREVTEKAMKYQFLSEHGCVHRIKPEIDRFIAHLQSITQDELMNVDQDDADTLGDAAAAPDPDEDVVVEFSNESRAAYLQHHQHVVDAMRSRAPGESEARVASHSLITSILGSQPPTAEAAEPLHDIAYDLI